MTAGLVIGFLGLWDGLLVIETQPLKSFLGVTGGPKGEAPEVTSADMAGKTVRKKNKEKIIYFYQLKSFLGVTGGPTGAAAAVNSADMAGTTVRKEKQRKNYLCFIS